MNAALDPRRCALLLLDLQHDFLAADGAYGRAGIGNDAARALPARLAPLAGALRQAGGLIVASRFTLWPDAGGEPMIAPHLRRLRPFLVRGDFAPGSRGQGVIDTLAPLVHLAVDKVAYSAFFDTQLDWLLRHAGIETLLMTGLVTNGGVASTVRDAHTREFHVILLEDGCAAFDVQRHDAAIADLRALVEVSDVATISARLPR
jgi:ureidoacrylate peracid hydrolase